MKPDRFEKMVEHTARQIVSDLIPGDNKNAEDLTIVQQHLGKFLSRQFSQLRRAVERQQRWKHDTLDHLVTEPDGEWVRRGDLLAAMDQYKRGEK